MDYLFNLINFIYFIYTYILKTQMSDNKYIKIFILICSLLYTCKTKE